MLPANAALEAVLSSGGPFVMADLWVVTLNNGTIIRSNSSDTNLTVDGVFYPCDGPIFSRDSVRQVVGLESDSLSMTIQTNGTDQLLGQSWPAAARAGKFDGARVELRRFISDSFDNTAVGSLPWFNGRAYEPDVDRFSIKLTVKSDLELLDTNLPKDVYQPGCLNTVYDGGCKLSRASKTLAATVAAGANTQTTVLLSGFSQADGWADLGVLEITSGPNAGLTRRIRSQVGATITLSLPLPVACSVGVAVNVVAGCNGTRAMCASAKFNNEANFRGTPYIPKPEAAL